jgi:hypothetical protein
MVRKTPPTDRDKVKIASFRITEGEWYDFSEEADRQNVTATDVIKGAIRNFMAGEFVMPEPVEPPVKESGKEWTATEIERVVSTAGYIRTDEARSIAESVMEQAIAPIQSDLAELLLSIDAVRNNLDDQGADLADLREKVTRQGAPISEKKPVSSGAQASKPKAAVTKPDGEVGKVVDRLLKDANLLRAVRAAITVGGTSSEIGDRLLKAGHGTVNGGPHSPAAISRFRAAVAYLDGGTDGH